MSKILAQDIINLFEEAARTDRRLPPAFTKQKTTAWLDYSQEKMYQSSWHKTEFKIMPNQQQVSRWWIASELLRLVIEDIDNRKLIWARAKKMPFTQLGRMFGCSRHKIKNKYLEEIAYLRLWLELHKNNKKINDIINKIIDKKR